MRSRLSNKTKVFVAGLVIGIGVTGVAASHDAPSQSPEEIPADAVTDRAQDSSAAMDDSVLDEYPLVAQGGELARDSSGRFLVIDMSKANEVMEGRLGPALDKEGNLREWMPLDYLDDLLTAGAVTAYEPGDDRLAKFCVRSTITDGTCELLKG